MTDYRKLDLRDEETDDEELVDDDAGEFLHRIDTLRDDPATTFADDTLRGIYDTVLSTKRVTEGQRRAVDNIKRSVDERRDQDDKGPGWRRRYEGR